MTDKPARHPTYKLSFPNGKPFTLFIEPRKNFIMVMRTIPILDVGEKFCTLNQRVSIWMNEMGGYEWEIKHNEGDVVYADTGVMTKEAVDLVLIIKTLEQLTDIDPDRIDYDKAVRFDGKNESLESVAHHFLRNAENEVFGI